VTTAACPRLASSFETEVLQHLGAVHAFARKLTGHEQDAEDLAHDALLRACRFSHRFERGTNLKAWLFRIVRNTFINRWRERQRRPTLETALIDFEALAEARGPEIAERGGAPFADPLSAAEDGEIGESIAAAMAELTEAHRDVVTCCLVEGLTYQEAARVLRVPAGTIMSRLHRGRKQLQQRLEAHAAERGLVAA
jgi:RNA polymerase sigma-70 factor (ECF subfamily)